MKLSVPVMRGIIDRRILVNYRVQPEAIARWLPPPFRPLMIRGWGMVGICLIRLKDLRPRLVPAGLGVTSENAAHRFAVEWDAAGEKRAGVFIPRRDTDSVINRLAGGRLFPGVHHAAEFHIRETSDLFELEMRSTGGRVRVVITARRAAQLPGTSIFHTLDEASAFFRSGAPGWSVCGRPGEFDGLELRCPEWQMEPLAVERVESSFFSDTDRFPLGSVEFDSAFLMRGLAHEWHSRGRWCAAADLEPA